MEIYERIFARLVETNMSQSELSRKTGIPTSTISDWKKKKINPQADKLFCISKVLGIPLTTLLCDDSEGQDSSADYVVDERFIIESFRRVDKNYRKNIIQYFELLELCNELNSEGNLERNAAVIQDVDGNNIVVINDIRFKGKRSINWKDVREYLKTYIGDFYTIASTGDVVYIGSDLASEYSGSLYTRKLKGTIAKAKANAAQGLPEMIEISTGKTFRENKSDKHNWNAKFGWYRYDSRFALPVYDESGEISRYNVFHASMLIRHSNDGKMYLYDITDIKKETSNPLES